MGEVIDFAQKKKEKEELDELCNLVEQALEVPHSDSWEFQKRLYEKQWKEIVGRYNGASALDIFCDMIEGFSADK